MGRLARFCLRRWGILLLPGHDKWCSERGHHYNLCRGRGQHYTSRECALQHSQLPNLRHNWCKVHVGPSDGLRMSSCVRLHRKNDISPVASAIQKLNRCHDNFGSVFDCCRHNLSSRFHRIHCNCRKSPHLRHCSCGNRLYQWLRKCGNLGQSGFPRC